MHQVEDAATGQRHDTSVRCMLLDPQTCRCSHYPHRSQLVSGCHTLTPDNIGQLTWLPESCAYRRLATGRRLPAWHPLRTGDPESVHRAGASVRGRPTHSFAAVADLTRYLVQWTFGERRWRQ